MSAGLSLAPLDPGAVDDLLELVAVEREVYPRLAAVEREAYPPLNKVIVESTRPTPRRKT